MEELMKAMKTISDTWDTGPLDMNWGECGEDTTDEEHSAQVGMVGNAVRAYRKFVAKKAVDDWCEKNDTGAIVDVTKDDGSVLRTTTRSSAFLSGDQETPVIMLKGIAGWYLLERVKRIPRVTEEEEELLDYERSSGGAECITCGEILYKHPEDLDHPGYDGRPFLVRDCIGRLWKL